MTPFSQFALLDAVVAGCKWRTCPASNSGTQPSHSKLYTNREKNRLVLQLGSAALCTISDTTLGRLTASVPADLVSRCYTQQSRPHPPRADGEQDGAASDATKAVTDPIRLVRMVKEIAPLPFEK